MSVFDDLVGQDRAIAAIKAAAEDAHTGGAAMSHAWLITGPPGSGRTVAARAFAAALQCTGDEVGCGQCAGCSTVMAKSHPDVEYLSAEGSVIPMETVRAMIPRAQAQPTVGQWRVVIVEQADRMLERTTNVLLKSIEEPPPRTVWILSTSSPQDVLITIRSRCRHLNLVIPPADAVAELLVRRGADERMAHIAARVAQSHIGRAQALATDPEVRAQRDRCLRAVLGIRSTPDAVYAAKELHEVAKTASQDAMSTDIEEEKRKLRRSLGMPEDEPLPPKLRSQEKALEKGEAQKKRRALHDALDRQLIDLLALQRDILLTQLDAGIDVVNADLQREIEQIAAASSARQTMARMDAITLARERLAGNANELLTLEGLLVGLRQT
ncbi:MAG: DNA polymerase III subunit delta' [Flaviflexus sp.]|nr:DNA polymerase III subunit delta' [Flaviflexus sp.]